MTILYLHKCPRPGCGGPVEANNDPLYRWLRCIFCGWRIDTPVKKQEATT